MVDCPPATANAYPDAALNGSNRVQEPHDLLCSCMNSRYFTIIPTETAQTHGWKAISAISLTFASSACVAMVVNLGKLGYISSGKKKPFEISSTMTVWAPRQKLREQRVGKVHVIV